MTFIHKIVNAETGEIIERPFTKDEIAFSEELTKKQNEIREIEIQANVEAKAKREMLLKKLGITEEEAKLLLS